MASSTLSAELSQQLFRADSVAASPAVTSKSYIRHYHHHHHQHHQIWGSRLKKKLNFWFNSLIFLVNLPSRLLVLFKETQRAPDSDKSQMGIISFSISLPVNSLFPCLKKIGVHLSYAYRNLNRMLNKMKSVMGRLEAVRNDMLRRVEDGERDGHHRRLCQVENWLTRVDVRLLKERNLDDHAKEVNDRRCLYELPINMKNNYVCYRKITRMIEKMEKLITEGQGLFSGVVVERFPVPPPTIRPQDPTVGFDPLVDEVLDPLAKDHLHIIGLCGMGGVGKTTLLTLVHNRLVTTVPIAFQYVIWVDVENGESIEAVIHIIGKKIGLDEDFWEKKSLEEKSVDITRVLLGKKFILMLDDLTAPLDILKVGIPLENQSKLIFTTREDKVCCDMGVKKKVMLKPFSAKLAVELFRRNVGNDEIFADARINSLANIIVQKCDGLPLALKAIGRTMSNKKTPREWKNGLVAVSSYDITLGLQGDIFPRLKVSYDNLPNDMLKACLLRFALNPAFETWDVGWSILMWYEEGFLGADINSIEDFENRGYAVVDKFINSCLVEVVGGKCGLRLHEVMRNTLLWIACMCMKEEDRFYVSSGTGLTLLPNVARWENARVVSFMLNQIKEILISNMPRCHNLEALYLRYNSIHVINYGFLSSMPHLKILDLSDNESLIALPLDIACLGSLEYLNLEWTGIKTLPMELNKVTKLKVLNIRNTKITFIPIGLLTSLINLKVFRMSNWPCTVVPLDNGNNVLACGNKLLIHELGQHQSLIAVELAVGSVSALQTYLNFHELMTCTTALSIENLFGLDVEEISMVDIGKHLENIRITNCVSLRAISYEQRNLNNTHILTRLRHADINSCPRLKDLCVLAYALSLESLSISNCNELEEIVSKKDVRESDDRVPFIRLRVLELQNLPKLSTVCHDPLPLENLKSLNILYCPKLENLSIESNLAHSPRIEMWAEAKWWSEVPWSEDVKSLFDVHFL